MLPKTSKRRETSIKESTKLQAIASAGSEALGSLWELWELPGGSWRAREGLQGALGASLYRQKLPINRTAAVML